MISKTPIKKQEGALKQDGGGGRGGGRMKFAEYVRASLFNKDLRMRPLLSDPSRWTVGTITKMHEKKL
jgi:hypothetical protein